MADSSHASSSISVSTAVSDHGFAILPGILSPAEIGTLRLSLGEADGAGSRDMLRHPEVARWARSERFLKLVRPHLPSGHQPVAVRGIYFDKSPDANWLVPWHQDLTLALRKQRDVLGFGPWSVKDGIPHVQPPVGLLENMITLRLHLDDTDETNGALRVVPGSHAHGRLTAAEIQEWRTAQSETLCPVSAGGVLLMRPLLLHASGRSVSPGHRRVLHLEYAAFDLPGGMEWEEAGWRPDAEAGRSSQF
jgi:hypothetical protein